MSLECRQRLDAIGFVWDQRESAWEEGFAALTAFKSREGHCNVPSGDLEDESGFKLGQWVSYQHNRRYIMSRERRQRLDAIGFVWNRLERGWEEGFAALTEFRTRHGHCRVPQDQRDASGFRLGRWVGKLRGEGLTSERKQRLDAIGFVWNPFDQSWEDSFAALIAFKSREGHCVVPDGRGAGALQQLAKWVSHQRHRRNTMSAERRTRLDQIGFAWDPQESSWEEGFTALRKFNEREGNCRVPISHVEGVHKLGAWVSYQRRRKDVLSDQRKRRLETLPGWVWKVEK
jgi:hypothetical protein